MNRYKMVLQDSSSRWPTFDRIDFALDDDEAVAIARNYASTLCYGSCPWDKVAVYKVGEFGNSFLAVIHPGKVVA